MFAGICSKNGTENIIFDLMLRRGVKESNEYREMCKVQCAKKVSKNS